MNIMLEHNSSSHIFYSQSHEGCIHLKSDKTLYRYQLPYEQVAWGR